MKFYITLFMLAIVMILAVSAFAGEEPYKAAVYEDSRIPPFYISPKLAQFTHPETFYYAHCYYYFCNPIGPVDPEVCVPLDGNCFICSSKCKERFNSKTAPIFPEICCNQETIDSYHCSKTGESCNPIDPNCEGIENNCISDCPGVGNSRITKGNSGWYEWVIGLPQKPEGELNIEIECGVLKPNAWELFGQDAINLCAAETGETISPGLCKRKPNKYPKAGALPKITAIAYPGSQNYFEPFHLTAYKNPSTYALTKKLNPFPPPKKTLKNSVSLQVLDGSPETRIVLKPCMNKTIIVKWPTTGLVNVLGETEANLEAGDLIKVRIDISKSNTVDIYCSAYSVKIGGIGEPTWVPAGELLCLYDQCCLDGCCINDECGK